jgi:hypothetical protein
MTCTHAPIMTGSRAVSSRDCTSRHHTIFSSYLTAYQVLSLSIYDGMHMGIGHDEEKWVELNRLPSITFTLHQPQMRPQFRNLQQASKNESRKERGTHDADEGEKNV